MIWEELSKIALIGTERAALSDETRAALAKLGVNVEEGDARALLEGAALYHPLRRASFPLASQSGEPVQLAPIEEPSSGLKPPAPRAAQHLRLILSGRYAPALPEYLALCQSKQQGLPPEFLPALFRLALKHPAVWEALRPCLGAAAHWLLRQNPDWQALAEDPALEAWPKATMPQRQAMLRYLRHTQPEQGPPLLKMLWEEAPYTDQQAFLRIMAIGLSDTDEAFLESCLDARRKEVRAAAAALLCRLPDSALSQRLLAQAQALFAGRGPGGLKLNVPRDLSEPLKRDGIGQGSGKYPGGKKFSWAGELLSKIPPRRWEEHFGLPTLETLRLLAASKERDWLLEAITQAALLHQDHRWMEAILRYWLRTNDEKAWNSKTGRLLITQLPGPVFNELARQQLRQQAGPLEERSLLFLMLVQGPQRWEDQLAVPLLQSFREWMTAARSYHWNLWHYKRLLRAASYRISPRLLEGLRGGWPAQSPVWPHWEKEVEGFLRVLGFRREWEM
jgi:hypothetical protein